MNETEILATDQAVMGKTIGIIRGLAGKTGLQISFNSTNVFFHLSVGKNFSLTNELFNKLETKEIVNLIEGHIDGSN